MGLFEFLIISVVVVFICWLAVYAAGYLAPGHPAIIDKLFWGLGVVIILVMFIQAIGLIGHDVMIPRLR